MRDSLKTYEEKHSIGIFFPTLHHHLVLCNSPVEIHGERGFRTIGKVGFFLRDLILLGLCNVIYRECSESEGGEVITIPYLDPVQPWQYHE
jgi:hypothetical protein